MTNMSQGPWTRIRPLQIDEVDDKTAAAFKQAELTWGHFPNNLIKVMGYCPRLAQTEVEYVNTFIFDPVTMEGDLQTAGFLDRFLRELVISRTSLENKALYSITHHSFIGMALYKGANRAAEGHEKLLHLHEHAKHADVYTELERVVLDYTVLVTRNPHEVTDSLFERLKLEFRKQNSKNDRLRSLDGDQIDRYISAQIVELTWLIGHFCLLNRWFTALQVPDETEKDEANFLGAYADMVPADIRARNDAVLSSTPTQPD